MSIINLGWEMKRWIKLIVVLFVLVACKNFEPVTVKDDPQRSDFYTVLKYYDKTDSAFIGTVYNSVLEADKRKLKEEKILKCKKLYFGEKPINKNDREQYNLYLECLAK